MILPYDGIRVLDFSQGVAGPHCGMLFALYGADVIKIEPPEGDWSRPLGTVIDGMSAIFVAYNQGKRGLVLDLATQDGVSIVHDLVRGSDVVIENFRHGVIDRLGLGWTTLKEIQPKLIHVAISGFGQTGPDRTRPATDSILQTHAGLMALNRGIDGLPHKVRFPAIDHVTGLYAFQAAAMALMTRDREGRGRYLDISLLQSSIAFQGVKILDHHVTGGNPPEDQYAPIGIYPTRDGSLAVSTIRQRQFRDLCEVLGCAELESDPRFNEIGERMKHVEELNALLALEFATRTTAEWSRRLTEKGVMNSPVRDYSELLDDAHVKSAALIHWIGQPGFAQVPLARVPGADVDWVFPAPALGEHSDEILAELGSRAGGEA